MGRISFGLCVFEARLVAGSKHNSCHVSSAKDAKSPVLAAQSC
jgi:hypothetical protein